jgi:multicomponent Na+:H+ antiporter subunit B
VTPAVRRWLFLASAAVVGAGLLWGLGGLPPFGRYLGPYGYVINRLAVPARHTTEAVGSVVMDFRGADTMGEEFILFASVVGVAMLLRVGRQEEEAERPADRAQGAAPTTDGIRAIGVGLVGPCILLGLYVVAHGHLTPGGGFQGGVVLATASVMVFLTGKFLAFRRLNPLALVEGAEGIGAAGFPLIGAIGLVAGAAFLSNVLPLGTPGELLSAGTIPLLNLTVGLEVAAGFVFLVFEFLEQTLAVHQRRGS